MAGNLKIQILEINIFENFCQNLKVRYFSYIICVRKNYHISGCCECFFNARRPNLWLLRLSNQGLCQLYSVTNTTKNFEKLESKISVFLIYGKMLVIQHAFMKKH